MDLAYPVGLASLVHLVGPAYPHCPEGLPGLQVRDHLADRSLHLYPGYLEGPLGLDGQERPVDRLGHEALVVPFSLLRCNSLFELAKVHQIPLVRQKEPLELLSLQCQRSLKTQLLLQTVQSYHQAHHLYGLAHLSTYLSQFAHFDRRSWRKF